MPFFEIQIERYVDSAFPGFVECAFVDAHGREHRFVEKVPVVTLEALHEGSEYPRIGQVACEIESSWVADDGRALSRVTTQRPWGIESDEGVSEFELTTQVLRP